jgi:hypothetical protein
MGKPVCCLTLPNSGSDWICRILAKHSDEDYYDKEFFNPITNLKHARSLELKFGCELVTCHRNIARECLDVHLDAIKSLTWDANGYTFTKEVYGTFKAEWFARRFNCFVLLRDERSVFPPRRLRVYGWYDAIWNSLVANSRANGLALDIEERCRRSFRVCRQQLIRIHTSRGLPRLDYRDLCKLDAPAIAEQLAYLPLRGLDAHAAAAEIVATRRPSKVR